MWWNSLPIVSMAVEGPILASWLVDWDLVDSRRRLFRLASRPHLWDFRYPVRPTNHTICKRIILKILKHFNKRINKRCEGRMEASRSLSGESLVTVSAWRLTKRFDVSYWFYNWLTKNSVAYTNESNESWENSLNGKLRQEQVFFHCIVAVSGGVIVADVVINRSISAGSLRPENTWSSFLQWKY